MKASTTLSFFAAAVSLCLGEAPAPTPPATATIKLTLGEDEPRNNWEVVSPGRSPEDIPPSILAKLDLMARSVELDTRAASGVTIIGANCPSGDPVSTGDCQLQNAISLNSGQKANFAAPVNFVIYVGRTGGCHVTLYDRANEQADGSEIRVVFTASGFVSIGLPLPNSGPHFVKSVGYFC